MEKKHTPLPWVCQGNIVTKDGNTIARTPAYRPADEETANAAFIVRACNAHDDLVAVVEKLTRLFAPRTEMSLHLKIEVWNEAIAALAKAKGNTNANA